MPNNDPVFNRDQFIRALYLALRKDALDYKDKKESTSNDQLFLDEKPLLYDFFIK